MPSMIAIIIALPLLAFVVLALAGSALPKRAVAVAGSGATAIAALLSIGMAMRLVSLPSAGRVLTERLWTWISLNSLQVDCALRLDPLSLVMVLVITVIGALILLYSCQFMAGEEEGYARYFAYMNLFVASMLVLVLADDLLFLFLGWEGVGLCSYLLIGFWYKEPANIVAARKAFIVTRIGDAALLVGLFLLAASFGTLRIENVVEAAGQHWQVGARLPTLAALLLLAGALGKSAQLPLQTWLPDAMAGPTPVSALIHAATMVTAGVYLIARMHGLFELAPVVMRLIALIGSATLLIAGLAGLVEQDLKRVLAYSTISQIGFMFVALGVGAWVAATFHFVTHAFFKSLLFLVAGIVIRSLDGEHNIYAMGGLARKLPLSCATFALGVCSLSAIPLVTAGFYSKDLILLWAWASPQGHPLLWCCGILGALLTSLYSFRMFFLAFFGEPKRACAAESGRMIMAPILVLAIGAVVTGFMQTPPMLGNVSVFGNLLAGVFGTPATLSMGRFSETSLELLAGIAPLCGLFVAWLLYVRNPHTMEKFVRLRAVAPVYAFMRSGFAFDKVYGALFVRPYMLIAAFNRNDFLLFYSSVVATLTGAAHHALCLTQNNRVRWYAAAIAAGAVIALTIGVFS